MDRDRRIDDYYTSVVRRLLTKPWQKYAAIVVVVLMFITGIVLICTSNQVLENEHILVEYSKCPNTDSYSCTEGSKPKCFCKLTIDLVDDLPGNVTMYYELETFMQNNESYAKSRDNKQLAGELSSTPSAACGEFTYDVTSEGRMPIAPCGAIADSMFNDSFDLITTRDLYVPGLSSGMLSEEDKKGFRNPQGDLEQAFKGFTKPKSWQQNIWEFSTTKYNNGFENEEFIAWMRTDWKRKPMWRVNHMIAEYKNGLPKGQYIIEITYAYPSTLYSGTRTLIAKNVYHSLNSTQYVCGIVVLIIACILAVIVMGAVLLHTPPEPRVVFSQDPPKVIPDSSSTVPPPPIPSSSSTEPPAVIPGSSRTQEIDKKRR